MRTRGGRTGLGPSAALGLALVGLTAGPGCPTSTPLDDDDDDSAVTDALQAVAPARLVGWVGEPLTFDGSESEGAVLWRWLYGDGERDESATEPQSVHNYAEPGHYSAFLEVEDAAGRRDSVTIAVTITHRPAGTPPQRASSLAASPDGTRLYAALPDFGLIAVVDRVAGEVVRHIEGCPGVRSVALAPDGHLAAACSEDDSLLLVAPDGTALRVELGWGARPFGVLFSDQQTVLATLQGPGAVVAVSTTGEELDRSTAGPDLRGLAFHEGRAVVSRHRSGDEEGAWWTLPFDGAGFGPATRYGVAPHPGPDSDTASRGLPSYHQRLAISADGRSLGLPGVQHNIYRGEARDGRALTHETTSRASLRIHGLAQDPGMQRLGVEFDDRGLASDTIFSAGDDWLYIALMGAATIEVRDRWNSLLAGAFLNVGQGIDGLWASPAGDELWALAELDRALVGFSLDSPTAGTERARIDLVPPSGEVLAPEELLGKQVFHAGFDPRMTFSGYLSCASCHLDGEHDGRTWDFTDRGEGLRNTASLRGMAGQGPLHWSGNFDEVQDFENDIRGPQAGAGYLDDADWEASPHPLGPARSGLSPELDAMAAWVATLDGVPRSPFRAEDGSLTAAAARGEALFLSAETGCADCHPPPSYTDSQWLSPGVPLLHDVGTMTADSGGRLGGVLEGIDTPSLRGLADSAPYLHDGSAATLEDVVERAGEEHGRTGHLSATERADLVLFLLSIE